MLAPAYFTTAASCQTLTIEGEYTIWQKDHQNFARSGEGSEMLLTIGRGRSCDMITFGPTLWGYDLEKETQGMELSIGGEEDDV